METADMVRARCAGRVERGLERERVHDRAEHAHGIGGRAVDPAGCTHAGAADDIAAADDDGDLEAGLGGAATRSSARRDRVCGSSQ